MSLPEPTTVAGRAGLAAVLAEPSRALVAVDYDGTLAPIVGRPEDARPAPGAVTALRALAGRVGRCAVVTGRPAAVVVELGGLGDVAGLVVLGHYGLQRWHDGELATPDPAPGVEVARRAMPGVLADAVDGVYVEDKEHSLVVHTRPAADPAAALAALEAPLGELAAANGLELVPGRLVLELRPPGVDKGVAVAALAAERDASAVVYVGDDLGDVPAYAAVEAGRHEGRPGLTVASIDPDLPDPPTLQPDQVDLVLAGPTAVVAFLTELAAAIGEP